MVRRIVRARVGSHPAAEDLVQETLTRVLAASATVEPGMLEPYAIVTARNVIATMWREPTASGATCIEPSTSALRSRRRRTSSWMKSSRPWRPRWLVCPTVNVSTLLDHEVSGMDTRTLARERAARRAPSPRS